MLIIIAFILAGVRKKINVYDAFIEGAKDGFTTAVRIIPYLIAILVGIGVFRASGAMDMLIDGIKYGVGAFGVRVVVHRPLRAHADVFRRFHRHFCNFGVFSRPVLSSLVCRAQPVLSSKLHSAQNASLGPIHASMSATLGLRICPTNL